MSFLKRNQLTTEEASKNKPTVDQFHSARKFTVKYNYDPKMGPNENPEAELSLKCGDIVYVSSEIDADGFFEG